MDTRMHANSEPVRQVLHCHRGSVLHVIDPYKVPIDEAVEKAIAIQRWGSNLIVVGSTDYEDFHRFVPSYLVKLKQAASPTILLHFPPRKGQGFPFCSGADGILGSCVLKTSDPYYSEGCLTETIRLLEMSPLDTPPVLLSSAAFTFGPDEKTYRAVRSLTCSSPSDLEPFLHRLPGFDIVYLYSRYASVHTAACRLVRTHLRPGQFLFVSGGVRTREHAQQFLEAGADFVVIGSALETPGWHSILESLLCEPAWLRRP